VYGTPSYFVQQLFMQNRGDVVLPVSHNALVPLAPQAGGIGLGTFETAAEFKDVRVTAGGKVLLSCDFRSSASGWSGGNQWKLKDGGYQQPDPKAKALSFAGETDWTDYEVSLKTRKLGGSEGFLILVRARGPQEYVVWNLGGWHNEFHGVLSHLGEQDQLLIREPGSIETGRWYDIKLQLRGSRLDCYLDGRHMHQTAIPTRRTPQFFASATRDDRTGEVILKTVNPTPHEVQGAIALRGLRATTAVPTVLTSSKPSDENSFEQPVKVSPAVLPAMNVKPEFEYTFNPSSMTVLRIRGSVAPTRASADH